MEMSCARMFRTSSVEYNGLEITGLLLTVVELLCPLLDGLVRLVLHLFLDAGLLG